MFGKIKISFFIFLCFFVLSSNTNAQLSDYKELHKYVYKQTNAPDAIKIIIKHLKQTATNDPLEELIRWANEGFPELHDENNVWRTSSHTLFSSVVSSINYYYIHSPPPNKAISYLETIEKLKHNSYITYRLTQTAFRILNEQELEQEFYRLIYSENSDERVRGLNLARVLADKKDAIFDIYIQTLKTDKNAQVRNTAMHVLGTIRGNYPRKIARVALEQLLVDQNPHVKQISAVIVKQGADFERGWTKQDSAFLLSHLLKTKDTSIQRSIGITVAKLTIEDKSLRIVEKKISENHFGKFIKQVELRESKLKRNLEDDELLTIWKNWWTPLISKYTVKLMVPKCGIKAVKDVN